MYGRANRPSLGQYDFPLREPVFGDRPTRSRSNTRFLEVDPPLRSLQHPQGDSSSSEDDIISKPKPVSKHARSMSHPFPSLFSKKKKNAAAAAAAAAAAGNELGYDDDVGDHDHSTKIYSSSSQAANANRAASGPAESATGHCMTCASHVRWPKDLQVFRCTKCLTINDLRPFTPAPRSTIRPVPRPDSRMPSAGTPPLGAPTSIRPLLQHS